MTFGRVSAQMGLLHLVLHTCASLLVVVKQLESCLPASPLVIIRHIWRPLTPSTFKAAPDSHTEHVGHTFHNKKKEVTNIFGDWDDPVLYILMFKGPKMDP